ncbi:hypothetical protein AKJ18_34925 [Vibrio xuii]|nr:hypothetical protein AKJ18_34925 [Vibrio xuii]
MSDYWILIGILLSVTLGALSYQFIEPIGQVKNNSLYVLIALLFVYLFSSYVRTDGMPERWTMSEEIRNIYSNISETPRKECGKREVEDACKLFSSNPSWVVFGDSHSYELAYSLGELLQESGDGVIEYSRSGCPIITNPDNKLYNKLYKKECADWRLKAIDLIGENSDVKNVVMINRYNVGLFGENELDYPNLPNHYSEQHRDDFFTDVETAISEISRSGKNIWLISGVPEMGQDIYSLIGQAYIKGINLDNLFANEINYQIRRNMYSFERLRAISSKYSNVHFVDIREIFCDNVSCYAIRDAIPLYRDDDHLSLLGAKQVGELLLEQYSKKLEKSKSSTL